MMIIESLVETDTPSVYAYTSTEVVKRKMLEGLNCLKVIDDNDTFLGLITPNDIFRQHYHLVVDCIQDKPALQPNHTIYEAAMILVQRQEAVAPVFSENNQFVGVLQKDNLMEYLLRYSIHLENQLKQQSAE